MTLSGKIKQALHMDKDKTSASSGSGTSNTAPQTGPDAYHPMQNAGGVSPDQSTGTGAGNSSSGYGNSGIGAGNSSSGVSSGVGQGQGYNDSNTGRSTATGAGQGGHNLAATQGAPSGRFSKGYTEDAPGYDSKFQVGQPQYREKINEGDDGSYSADLAASGGQKEWERARELTLAAEREAAEAQLSGNRANKELSAAEQAELAVRKAQAKHREALLEAEKYRGMMGDPSTKEAGVADARALYEEKQRLLAESEREMREAEADLGRKKRDADKLHPQVEQYGAKLPGLEDEYERRLRDREGLEGDRERMLMAAQNAERARSGYAGDLEALEAEQQRLENLARGKQQEYMDARNSAQKVAQQVADLKAKLREADAALQGHRGRAQEAEANLPAYREAEQRALRELEDSKSEWYRLKELEDQYARTFNDAAARLDALKGRQPGDKDLRDAQGLLASRQDDLDRARQRAINAEGKYKELLHLADRHKKYGDSAADAAVTHGEKYEDAKHQAHIHGDKHVEYWTEAKSTGEQGSSAATSAVKKLEEKVRNLMAKHEQ